MTTVGDLVDRLERLYDPALAEAWDAVGLVCGDPAGRVTRVHLAVDPVGAVVDEALASGAQLLVTHHPLFLGGTTSVAATSAKGRVVHQLIEGGCALYVAHTNADRANPGVSDALAAAIGLNDVQPLEPVAATGHDKIVTFVPADAVDKVLDAMAAAGAGTIGGYERCAFLADGRGTFVAGPGTTPLVGERGEVTQAAEVRLEMVSPRRARGAVVHALLAAHPYDEPAYDVVELAGLPGDQGLGRVGELADSTTLADFTRRVDRALPATAWGVRAAGDPRRPIRTVAVCGGSGGGLAATAAGAGADVLVTADLKHHATSEAVEEDVIALIDAAHWATEWPWLQSLAGRLAAGRAGGAADTVEATVSHIVTDPWNVHATQKDS